MTALVFGIGIGLFIILILWVAAALVFAVSLRAEKRIGAIAVAVAAIVTVILVNVPRSAEEPVLREDQPYDHIFIWRVLLLVLLVASSILAFLGYLKFELLEQTKPQKITTWVYSPNQ